MSDEDAVRVKLRGPGRSVVGYALIDAADAKRVTSCTWWLSNTGYAVRKTAGRTVYMHRLVLSLERGCGVEVDHINRDRLDNRRSNLRTCDRRSNSQNRESVPGSSSQYRGVSWSTATNNWRARVMLDGEQHELGNFAEEVEAANAASQFRAQHMPFSIEARS
jgi:hypothetical protein